jgi:imidazole glycerol-phosphate synthase subunit HisF
LGSLTRVLNQRVIPSLLLRNGRLVKGEHYQHHRDAGHPPTTARAHNAQGADELLLLDVDASREGRGPDLKAVRAVAAECFMPLTFGGGIDSVERARECIAAGADKIMVTSTAADDPELINRLAHAFGSQAVVLGIDVDERDGRRVRYDHRNHQTISGDWLAWAREGASRGAGEVRLMDVSREGTRRGPDLAFLSAARAAINLPLVVEGGAGSLDDLADMLATGADAVAVGALLVFADNNLVKVRRYLAGAGAAMRV